MSVLSQLYFHDEAAAYAKLESILWPNGPVCPHCGVIGEAYELEGQARSDRLAALRGMPQGFHREGRDRL